VKQAKQGPQLSVARCFHLAVPQVKLQRRGRVHSSREPGSCAPCSHTPHGERGITRKRKAIGALHGGKTNQNRANSSRYGRAKPRRSTWPEVNTWWVRGKGLCVRACVRAHLQGNYLLTSCFSCDKMAAAPSSLCVTVVPLVLILQYLKDFNGV